MSNYSFSLTEQAQQDIKDIWFHIAHDSIKSAEKIVEYFEQAFFKLASNPYLGSKRKDLTSKPVRFWIVYSYYIIYAPETNPLQILRVVSSYRNIKNYH